MALAIQSHNYRSNFQELLRKSPGVESTPTRQPSTTFCGRAAFVLYDSRKWCWDRYRLSGRVPNRVKPTRVFSSPINYTNRVRESFVSFSHIKHSKVLQRCDTQIVQRCTDSCKRVCNCSKSIPWRSSDTSEMKAALAIFISE
jgi:hypothetical protein